MHPEAKEELRVRFKHTVLQIAAEFGVGKTCHEFDVPRSTFYEWKSRYDSEGRAGLYRRKPIAFTHPRKTGPRTVEKILELRRVHKMGSKKITYYLERYHGTTVSESTVTRIFRAYNLRRLQRPDRQRVTHSKRYAKSVPGHHVQVDVKFLVFKDLEGRTVRRFQYTAIDDATRIRALKIYRRHTQANAIDFIDYVVGKFPFRIHTIRTDRGHEFQSLFHWHVEDAGMAHVYLRPRTPQLNGKVERSHRTDKDEFYQLLSYTDDVDLNRKVQAWEEYYNFHRPHFSHEGRTPYEVMRSLLV